jgi:putative endonuclease
MALSHEYGRICESIAARHLASSGWTIVVRNYRFGHREIDIIARREDVVAFVEVKGRSAAGFGHPLESITRMKRAEIERVAMQWVARYGTSRDVYRFDAIAVSGAGDDVVVEHVEDAWRM